MHFVSSRLLTQICAKYSKRAANWRTLYAQCSQKAQGSFELRKKNNNFVNLLLHNVCKRNNDSIAIQFVSASNHEQNSTCYGSRR